MEAARPELAADDLAAAGDRVVRAAGHHAEDERIRGLEREIDARVGDDALRERLAQIPLDEPEALDQVRKIRRRGVPGEPEVARRLLRIEDPALARGRLHPLSRSYNTAAFDRLSVGSMTQPIPEGYHTLTPCLVVEDGLAALDFYERAFGATVRRKLVMGGKLMFSELQLGSSIF